MKLSYNWLQELLPDFKKTPAEVAEVLTLHSFETVVSHEIKIDPRVTVAQITKLEPHPNADRLKLATINNGSEEITVVCGAPNIAVGQLVPFSPPGTALKDEEGHVFVLKETKIRGVLSPGMLNSPRELGLGDWHGGIWILPEEVGVGQKLADLIPADVILETDITPNRAHDCLSYLGVARELAALLDLKVNEPKSLPLPKAGVGEGAWQITIANPDLSPRYAGAALENLTVKPAPLSIQVRLLISGTRPINNLVDITNYVLYELGQPSHLFDADRLPGSAIGTRLAQAGEELADLDEITHQLTGKELVITSDDKPVALAGIMGGLHSGVAPTTTRGFLEVANFSPPLIQATSLALNTRTESSVRFAKGLSPELVAIAQSRCLGLLQEHAGAQIAQIIDNYPKPQAIPTINFHPARVSQVAGLEISEQQSLKSLQKLRCNISPPYEGGVVAQRPRGSYSITPPSDRLDLTGEHDLIEEVVRLAGLENITSISPPQVRGGSRGGENLPENVKTRETLRDALVQAGFVEVYNYSFETSAIADPLGLIDEKSLEITNPIAPEQKYLRQSLIPRLLENLVTNKAEIRKKQSKYPKAIFEITSVFKKGNGGQVPGVIEKIHLAGVTLDHTATEIKEILGREGSVGPLDKQKQLKLPYSLLRETNPITFEITLDK